MLPDALVSSLVVLAALLLHLCPLLPLLLQVVVVVMKGLVRPDGLCINVMLCQGLLLLPALPLHQRPLLLLLWPA